MPTGHSIRISAVLQQKLDAIRIVPVGFAKKHSRQAVIVDLATLDQDFESRVIASFRRMIRSFLVVRIGAPFKQQLRQLRVVGNSGGAVKHALPLRPGLVVLLPKAGIGARSRVKQRRRRKHETVRSGTIKPEVFREAQVSQRIPFEGTSLCCRTSRIERDESAHSDIVA